MASRLLSGSRPAKGPSSKGATAKNEQDVATRTIPSSSIPKRSSLTASQIPSRAAASEQSGTSKIPTSSSHSIFGSSRHRKKKEDVGSSVSTATRAPDVRRPTEAPPSAKPRASTSVAKSTSTSTSRVEPERATASSSIPRGVAGASTASAGFGIRTEISARAQQPQQRNKLRRKASVQQEEETAAAAAEPKQRQQRPEMIEQHAPEAEEQPQSQMRSRTSSLSRTPAPAASSTLFAPVRQPEFATSSSRMQSFVPPPKTSTPEHLPPPTSLGFAPAPSSTGSTQCLSESPSQFSRTSTPTSASSYSPGILQASKFPTAAAPPMPMPMPWSRPPVTRSGMGDKKGMHGLPPVRESLTSSSSGSTVKAEDARGTSEGRLGRKMSREPPPTPPLRISSKRGRNVVQENKNETMATKIGTQDQKLSQLPVSQTGQSSSRLPPREDSRGPPPLGTKTSQIARPSNTRTSSRHPATTLNAPTRSQPRKTDTPAQKLPSQGSAQPAAPQSRIPPPRPSREGTPKLESQPSPVIQSNMSHIATTGHKRRESVERALAAAASTSVPPRRGEETGSLLYRSSSNARRPPPNSSTDSLLSKRDPSPITASASPGKSRFGLFSRRTKATPPPPPQPALLAERERIPRKGPATGTGHEGYGKYGYPGLARRGRSSSSVRSTTSADRTSVAGAPRPVAGSRKSSFASNDGSKTELDDFLKDRLEPVVIGGGGQIRENRNSFGRTSSGGTATTGFGVGPYRTMSEQSATSSTKSSAAVSRELLPAPHIVPARGISPSSLSSSSQQQQQDAPTLAHRRSLHRAQVHGEPRAGVLRIPLPIDTGSTSMRSALASPALETYDSTVSSTWHTDNSAVFTDDLSEGHEGNWLRSGGPTRRKINFEQESKAKGKEKEKEKEREKEGSKLTRKWNFFHRSQRPQPQPQPRPSYDSQDESREVTVAIEQYAEPRTVAHYAMLDGDEQEDEKDLDDLLRDIEGNLDLEGDDDDDLKQGAATSAAVKPFRRNLQRREESLNREPSMLLPSPPTIHSKFEPLKRATEDTSSRFPRPPQSVPQPQQQPQAPPQKAGQSRLQQVGRIPRVISKRDRLHNPSPQSFSRPFAPRASLDERSRPVPTTAPAATASSMSLDDPSTTQHPKFAAKSPSPERTSTDPLPSRQWETLQFPSPPGQTNAMLFNLDGEHEFLHFSPPQRKGSEFSQSTTTGSIDSASFGVNYPALAPFTAVPQTLADAALSEDDVWDEFDELLDHVASPVPFSPENEAMSDQETTPKGQNVQAKGQNVHALQALQGQETTPKGQSVYASQAPKGLERKTSSAEKNKKNKKNKKKLERLETVPIMYTQERYASPVTFSSPPSDYEPRSRGLQATLRNNTQSIASTVSGSRYSSQSQSRSQIGVSRSGSHSSVGSGHDQRRVTKLMAEKTLSPSVASSRQSSRTEPEHAGADDCLRFSALMTSRWLCFDRVLFSPVGDAICTGGDQRILVLDGLENDDWSTYCALTYPEATFYYLSVGSGRSTNNQPDWQPPPNHRRIAHSSLTDPFPFPGGLFSAVVLRFPRAAPQHTLRSTVSECKRVLRPGGYLEMCLLDMDPVNMGDRARRLVRSLKLRIVRDAPETSLAPLSDTVLKLLGRKGFEDLNRCLVAVPAAGAVGSSSSPSSRPSQSLGHQNIPATAMAAAITANGTLVDGISAYPVAQVVARVARWWWSRCYETTLAAPGEQSIWADEQLLRECEERETGFKLVVCYAQKPSSTRRRTVSL